MEKRETKQVYCKNRAAWRSWLLKNYEQKQGVWLVYDKGENRKLTSDDITEEAICFGWIDSLPKALDDKRSMLYIAPRKVSSNWSRLNRQRAVKMLALGKMHSSGKRTIEVAKTLGTWNALNEAQNSVVPKDLASEFRKNKLAEKNFKNFPRSSKRIILEWILNAKRPETRKARIVETVKLAAKNMKVNHYRQ